MKIPTQDDETLRKLGDLAALRIVLTGDSVVDSGRLWFKTRRQVDDFLRLSGFDTDSSVDMARLHEIHAEAIAYLVDAHDFRCPVELEEPHEMHDLFLAASFGPRRLRRSACMLLKVMHILQHIAGREVAFNLPISEAELLDRLNSKVFGLIDQMRAGGLGVKEFAAGKKTQSSLITKLLAKRNTLATHVFDRLRYRIIVETSDDLVRALLHMVHTLFPFNYVVPEQSMNGIIGIEDLARVFDLPLETVRAAWGDGALASNVGHSPTPQNEFSGSTYRCVNFVADIPVRMDDLSPEQVPAIAYVQAEIQLIDRATEAANSAGDNAHPRYKERQRDRVRRRLESGLAGEGDEGGNGSGSGNGGDA